MRIHGHPVGLFAKEESDGGDAGGDNAARASVGIRFDGCGMRRQASPAYGTRQTEFVERIGVVIAQTPRNYVALPCISGNLESLQLADNFEQSRFAIRL